MVDREVQRMSAESIDDIEGMRRWARYYTIHIDSVLDQMQGSIETLQNRCKENERMVESTNARLFTASVLFASVLCIVVLISGFGLIMRLGL